MVPSIADADLSLPSDVNRKFNVTAVSATAAATSDVAASSHNNPYVGPLSGGIEC